MKDWYNLERLLGGPYGSEAGYELDVGCRRANIRAEAFFPFFSF